MSYAWVMLSVVGLIYMGTYFSSRKLRYDNSVVTVLGEANTTEDLEHYRKRYPNLHCTLEVERLPFVINEQTSYWNDHEINTTSQFCTKIIYVRNEMEDFYNDRNRPVGGEAHPINPGTYIPKPLRYKS